MRRLTARAESIALRKRFDKSLAINCPLFTDLVVETVGDFMSACAGLLQEGKVYWFRGHSKTSFRLCPAALRYPSLEDRKRALGLLGEARRVLEFKLQRPPQDELGWMQVAQHYGVPTRLLDWTLNAAAALFFTCWKDHDDDGVVAVLDPRVLNQGVGPREPRVFNWQGDRKIIEPYLRLAGTPRRGKSLKTIAIDPTWNNERMVLQQGVFTLHGDKDFELDQAQCSSLFCIPIPSEIKRKLLHELQRIGIGEMHLFPEPEHVCAHLRRDSGL